MFPAIELFDRYAIACVKWQRTQANQEELNFYQQQIELFDITIIAPHIDRLIEIHNSIWELEAELKTGVEYKLHLEEIGRRAIKIRDYNNKRINIKNQIAEKLGSAIFEIKQDHLSE
jgi:hypothetical protein